MTGEAAPEGEKQKAMSRVAPKFDSCGYVYRSDTGSPLTLVAGDTGPDTHESLIRTATDKPRTGVRTKGTSNTEPSI